MTLNELVKLTTLWKAVPRFLQKKNIYIYIYFPITGVPENEKKKKKKAIPQLMQTLKTKKKKKKKIKKIFLHQFLGTSLQEYFQAMLKLIHSSR